MGLIISDERELYMEIDTSYYEADATIKSVYKWEKPSKNNFTYDGSDNKVIKAEENIESKYKFGEILSLHGTKEKCIFVCQRGRFLYTCSLDSVEFFTGMVRVTEENIADVYDSINNEQKASLLNNLAVALDINKYIPEKAKQEVSKLVKNS